MNNIKVIETNDKDVFEKQVQDCINKGFEMSSTSCGFANSEKYGFCYTYQAILIKNKPKEK